MKTFLSFKFTTGTAKVVNYTFISNIVCHVIKCDAISDLLSNIKESPSLQLSKNLITLFRSFILGSFKEESGVLSFNALHEFSQWLINIWVDSVAAGLCLSISFFTFELKACTASFTLILLTLSR